MVVTDDNEATQGPVHGPYTRSLVYKGWLIRDAFQRLLDLLEILRDEV